MAGEVQRDDERFTLGGTDYGFRLPPRQGALGGTSSSPFAPKSVSGERAYADYDTFSALALADFSGGMGQEKQSDATMYYNAVNVDARSGSLILGPYVYQSTAPTNPSITSLGESWEEIGSANYTRLAGQWVAPADTSTNQLYRVWLPLKAKREVGTITVKLYDSTGTGGLPGSAVGTATIAKPDYTAFGQWTQAVFSSPVSVTAGATYWISVEQTGATPCYLWLTRVLDNAASAYWDGAAWQFNDPSYYAFWADIAALRPDSPPHFLTGAGEDEIVRVWAYAGRALYYMDSTGAPAPVGASTGGATKLLSADIVDAAWYRSSAATHPSLYLALGESTPIEAFDGNLADITWQTQSGNYAIALCVHDNLLFYAYARNKVDAFNGSAWHSTASPAASPAEVGDRTYPIRNLISWNGYLWAGKDDGLYKITNPTGYPSTGTLTSSKVLDFSATAYDVNFALMVVHNGDLYFSINNGLLKYTTGDVLTSISPDAGLDLAAEKRVHYRAAASTVNTLWVVGEGALDGDSVLLAYTEGHWHPVYTASYIQNQAIRSLVVEPGWYGDLPRLWFGTGLRTAYVEMPTTTQHRWLWDSATYGQVTYALNGYLYTSWFDGNIRTINKDWVQVELDVRNVGAAADGAPYIAVAWRSDDAGSWVTLGTVETNGLSTLTFPAASYSAKCQLRIYLYANTARDATPRVEAVVLKYLERPADLRTYTRTYYLADRMVRRNGVLVNESLAEQLAHLRTLRQSPEPLTWYAWWGTAYTVHMVDYSWSEARNETIPGQDKGGLYVTLRLVEL